MVEGMAPGPVTVRTFDVDEDQLAHHALSDAAWLGEESRGTAH